MAKKFSKFVLFSTIAAGAAAYFYYRRSKDEAEFVDDFDDFDLDEDEAERTYVNLGEGAEKAADAAGEAAAEAADAAADTTTDLKEKAAKVGKKFEKKAGEIAKGTKAVLKDGIEAVKKAADNVKTAKTEGEKVVDSVAEDVSEKVDIPISDGEDLFDDTES